MTQDAGRLGRYRILSELGRGAMGVVYKALDPQLDRTVAVKTIRMSSDATEMAEYVQRFRQEAKALGGLNHPGIISVFDAGQEGDVAYMAMELLEGVELRDLIAKSQLSVAQGIDLGIQIAEALAFAHERGVVHRDIKPANIMVIAGNRAKIMDFGIARVRASDVKTQTGLLLGSPKYMSPEQILGRPVDHRSDIFSLGVLLYEMLAGTTPFSGADLNQLMYQVLNVTPPPLRRVNPAVPDVLDFAIAKALEKTAESRYQGAAELAAELRAAEEALKEATRVLDRRDFQGETWPLENDDAAKTMVQPRVVDDAKTWVVAREAQTQRLAGPGEAPPQAPADVAFMPALNFASAAAIARLAAPSGSDRRLLAPDQRASRRWRHDRHLLLAAGGLLGAMLVSLMLIVL